MTQENADPPLRVHKFTRQCYVNLSGRRHYLGKVGSPGVELLYHRTLAEWRQRGCQTFVGSDLTVVELSARFMRFAQTYYRDEEGKPTSSLSNYRVTLRMLDEMYGTLTVDRFGPLQLKTVRQKLIDLGRARKTINDYMHLIRSVFRWGVSEGIVPVDVYTALTTVTALRRNRSGARETKPVVPVPEEYVEAVCKHAPDEIAGMLRLQLLTACRPGEIVLLRLQDLDCRGKVWLFKPHTHKNIFRGHARVIYVGPAAQAVLTPFLAGCPTDQYVFSPRRVLQRKAEAAETHRRAGQADTPRKTDRKVRDRYDVGSYRRAVTRIIENHDLEPFTLHQLRHTAATRIRAEFGLEMAQLACGHKHVNTTEIYAESATQKALQVFAKIG